MLLLLTLQGKGRQGTKKSHNRQFDRIKYFKVNIINVINVRKNFQMMCHITILSTIHVLKENMLRIVIWHFFVEMEKLENFLIYVHC